MWYEGQVSGGLFKGIVWECGGFLKSIMDGGSTGIRYDAFYYSLLMCSRDLELGVVNRK